MPPDPHAPTLRSRWLWGLLPLALLGVLVAVFLRVGPVGIFRAAFPPVEELTIDRVRLSPGGMVVHLTNGGPDPVTVAQVLVDEAYWHFTIRPGRTIPRLGSAEITVPYPWVAGETHRVAVITATGLTFGYTVDVAVESPRVDARYFVTFTLLGVYVGVLPVFLGLLWLPWLRDLGRRWMAFFLSLTAGLLLFLGVGALEEALETAGRLPAAYRGVSLVLVGAGVTLLALVAVSRRMVAGVDPAKERLALAFLIAVGIGLHNLGEGLAIGSAYSLGKIALGTFLVVGFTIHNTTEGLGIVSPIARDRPALRTLGLLGAIAGAPTILGAWLGGLNYSPTAATLFLAIGAGAIFQVVYEVLKLMFKEERAPLMGYQLAGFAAGLLVMYLTGLLVAV